MTTPATDHASAPYHHGDLRALLVRVGRDMLERDGLRGFSLRALARAAGVSHAAPVHHFRNLSTLLAACAADGYRELSDALEAARAAEPEPRGTLGEMAAVYLHFAERHPVLFHLMFDRQSLAERTPEFGAEAHRAYELLCTAVRAAARPGDAAAFDQAVNTVWGLIHGMSVLSIEGQICRTSESAPDTATMLRAALHAVVRGHVDPPGR